MSCLSKISINIDNPNSDCQFNPNYISIEAAQYFIFPEQRKQHTQGWPKIARPRTLLIAHSLTTTLTPE